MPPLPQPVRHLLVSILVFSGTENIVRLLGSLADPLEKLKIDEGVTTTIVIRFNNPMLETTEVKNRISELARRDLDILLFEGPNLGFSRGHNKNFRSRRSDFFLILNDGVDLRDFDWLRIGLGRFQSDSKLALVGDRGNPKYLTPYFGHGGQNAPGNHYLFRYAEASVLLARSTLFERIGMFDESIEWAMGEDADLSLTAQSMGYRVDFIAIPHERERGTSFNKLPDPNKATVQEHNRARLFAKWAYALSSGQVGEVEIFHVYSGGMGDVFCALIHIDSYLRGLSLDYRQRIIINTRYPDLAKMLLPEDTRIVSEADQAALIGRFSVSGFRTTQPMTYALPFNVHSLFCGVLSVPMASPAQAKETVIRAIAPVLAQKDSAAGSTCVVHVQCRDGHDGRVLSKKLRSRLVEEVCRQFDRVLIVGIAKTVDIHEFPEWSGKIDDRQGRLDLPQLMAMIAQADFFVGVDSFPAHIAQIVGTPSAVVFGSVHPVMRVWNERQTWPITADLDCIGCFHNQIEMSIPFCMRRDIACMSDIPADRITAVLRDMRDGAPFDWTKLRKSAEQKHSKFIHLLNHHPAPARHFLRPAAPNNELSNLFYEMVEKISIHTGRRPRSQVIGALKEDNDGLARRLESAESSLRQLRSLHGAKTMVPYPKHATNLMGEMFTRVFGCSLTLGDNNFVVQSHSQDPQIYLSPINFLGGFFRLTVNATSDAPTRMQIFYRAPHEPFVEGRSIVANIGPTKNHLSFVRQSESPETIFLRIDPASRQCEVVFSGELFGNFEI